MNRELPAERELLHKRVAEVASRQWGNITAKQLVACDVSSSAISRWSEKGLLHRRHRGVYAFGALSDAPEARWAAALLAVKDGVLSRIATLALYGLWTAPRVTVLSAPRQAMGGATLKVRATARPEITRRHGFPTTPLPRTFLDLAADRFPIERLVHRAAASRLVELTDLRAYAEAHRGRPGAGALLTAATNPHYRSKAERDLHAWLTDHGVIATPNAPIAGHTVDFHVPARDLVIELDLDQTHGTAHAGRTDAARDTDLERAGLTVLRVDGG